MGGNGRNRPTNSNHSNSISAETLGSTKQRHYVDLPALRQGSSIEIEKTKQNWGYLNQRQKDKIRHEIPRSVYNTLISNISNVINSSNNTTMKAGQHLTNKVGEMYSLGNTDPVEESIDLSNVYVRQMRLEKIDRLHERESREITERHRESQDTLKHLFTMGAIATLGVFALKVLFSKK